MIRTSIWIVNWQGQQSPIFPFDTGTWDFHGTLMKSIEEDTVPEVVIIIGLENTHKFGFVINICYFIMQNKVLLENVNNEENPCEISKIHFTNLHLPKATNQRSPTRPIFTKWWDVLLPSLEASEIGCYNDHISLIFNRRLGGPTAEVPVRTIGKV